MVPRAESERRHRLGADQLPDEAKQPGEAHMVSRSHPAKRGRVPAEERHQRFLPVAGERKHSRPALDIAALRRARLSLPNQPRHGARPVLHHQGGTVPLTTRACAASFGHTRRPHSDVEVSCTEKGRAACVRPPRRRPMGNRENGYRDGAETRRWPIWRSLQRTLEELEPRCGRENVQGESPVILQYHLLATLFRLIMLRYLVQIFSELWKIEFCRRYILENYFSPTASLAHGACADVLQVLKCMATCCLSN